MAELNDIIKRIEEEREKAAEKELKQHQKNQNQQEADDKKIKDQTRALREQH